MSVAPFHWTDPGTWPWVIYVWLAFILAGWMIPVWRWLRRRRASAWPVVDGRIESVDVNKPNFSFTTKRGYCVAELGYSYSFAGTLNSGRYKREFPTQQEADEFVRDLQDKAAAVHYNPIKPSSSALLEPDIEFCCRVEHLPGCRLSRGVELRSRMDQTLPLALRLFFCHRTFPQSLGSSRVAPGAFFWMLHVGIFVVWFPAVLVAQRLVGNLNRRDLWKVVLKGSPDWMRYLVVRIFRLRLCEFSALHGQDSERQQRYEPTSLGLARFLRSLDGVTFGGARHSIHRCSCGGYEPALRQWAFGIAECDLLPQVRQPVMRVR
jgi:hypothetical protein